MSASPLVVASALLIACGNRKQLTAMDFVRECAPGASVYRCATLRAGLGGTARFPVGHLENISLDIDRIVKQIPAGGQVADIVFLERHRVFVYSLVHEYGHADVCATLRSELGEPQGRRAKYGDDQSEGTIPMQPYGKVTFPGDFWKTEDGYWMCSAPPFTIVYWASDPVAIDALDKHLDRFDRGIDRYVRKAPKAAALWEKLARALMGVSAGDP